MLNSSRSRRGTACRARFPVLDRASFAASITTSTDSVQATYSFRPVSTSSVLFLYHVCPDAQLFSRLSRVSLVREQKNEQISIFARRRRSLKDPAGKEPAPCFAQRPSGTRILTKNLKVRAALSADEAISNR